MLCYSYCNANEIERECLKLMSCDKPLYNAS